MTNFALVKIEQTPGGTTLANPDGTVRSLSPASGTPPTTYSWDPGRPPSTAGPYELCVIGGGVVAFNPLNTQPVCFPFQSSVPNMPGWAALGVDPL
jgi:hypothetical protein